MINDKDLTKTRALRRERRRRKTMAVHGAGMKKLAGRLSKQKKQA